MRDLPSRVNTGIGATGDREPNVLRFGTQQHRNRGLNLRLHRPAPWLRSPTREIRAVICKIDTEAGQRALNRAICSLIHTLDLAMNSQTARAKIA